MFGFVLAMRHIGIILIDLKPGIKPTYPRKVLTTGLPGKSCSGVIFDGALDFDC